MESNSSSTDGSASPKHNALQKQVAEAERELEAARAEVAFPASADKIRFSSEPLVGNGEEALQEYLKLLDSLACRLADERLRLTEQSERLAAARVQWDKEHVARVKDLEGHNLRLRKHERALEERSITLQQNQLETHQTRQSLEAWQARLTVESASWKSERERL